MTAAGADSPGTLDDATIEAIVRGDEVPDRLAALVAFARQVEATVDTPPPSPSGSLGALLAHDAAAVNQACSGVAMRRAADGFTVQVTAGTPPTY